MAAWHHQLNGHEFGWTPGVGEGQGGLVCCGSCGRKESDMTEQLNRLWKAVNEGINLASGNCGQPIYLVNTTSKEASVLTMSHGSAPLCVFSNIIKKFSTAARCPMKGKVLVAQLRSTLPEPMGCGLSGSSVYGILQARILAWVAFPSQLSSDAT